MRAVDSGRGLVEWSGVRLGAEVERETGGRRDEEREELVCCCSTTGVTVLVGGMEGSRLAGLVALAITDISCCLVLVIPDWSPSV